MGDEEWRKSQLIKSEREKDNARERKIMREKGSER